MRNILLLFIAIIISFCSCQNNSRIESEIINLTGRKIVFLDDYHVILTKGKHDFQKEGGMKVVSYIEDVKCTECAVKMITEWVDCVNNLSSDVEYVIVFGGMKNDVFEKELNHLATKCQIISYSSDIFKIHNKLDVLARNRTFLLNKKNEIVLVGEPFGNEKMKLLYSATIRSLNKKKTTTISTK